MAAAKKPWLPKECATADRLHAEGKTYREIGLAIGRSYDSVRMRFAYKNRMNESLDLHKAKENGAYSRAQLASQDDAFTGAMQRAMGGGRS